MSSPFKAPITLHDVAREAGVSLATASRSLNGSTRKVKDEFRDRVLAAALKLNYTPNLSAQAVARGATTSVALLVADISDPYFSSIAAGVIERSEDAGLIVTMSVTKRDPDKELALVRALRGQRPRIIVLAGSRIATEQSQSSLVAELEAFESTGGRVVFVSRNDMPFDTVRINNYGGAHALATELVGLGYRNFAAITGQRELLTAADRLRGFTDGLAEQGIDLPAERIVTAEFTRDGGFAGATELIERGLGDVDLIFGVNDVMAIGAMSGLRAAGIEPGTGMAVAGFDDIQTVRDVTPALTTVRIPLVDVGISALELALGERAVGADRGVDVDTEVVLRASTPPRH
ncbi:MAG TPA: LacI family DNA-binding transcriptional regulator [Glaciihabitans sp.]|jgi:LacI family transcriptional regulator|nr:LacI family DNA-binding transcriptional regulator [Glaciihabitans sp.]